MCSCCSTNDFITDFGYVIEQYNQKSRKKIKFNCLDFAFYDKLPNAWMCMRCQIHSYKPNIFLCFFFVVLIFDFF